MFALEYYIYWVSVKVDLFSKSGFKTEFFVLYVYKKN